MSVKKVCLGSLVVTLLGLGGVRGQGPLPPYGSMAPPPPPTGPAPNPAQGPALTPAGPQDPAAPSATGLSSWIIYPRAPGCCGPVGGDGPIGYEIYFRNGISFPFGPGVLGNSLEPGWDVQGGGRVLFFNPQVDAAWTLDLGLTNIHNFSDHQHTTTLHNVPLKVSNGIGGTTTQIVPELTVTPAAYNRTFADAAIGRQWWLLGTADRLVNQSNWRAGVDVGGRWGTSKLELDEIKHRTEVVYGMFVGLHSDVEIPCGNVVFLAGIRAEWSYTWSNILQIQRNSDVNEINLLFTLGVRF
jgi:hypothetical protein